MSTRGIIARDTGNQTFSGTYHHWDSYPTELGATLWHLYHEQFTGDLDAMLRTLIDEHPAGWSTINGVDWSQNPGYSSEGDYSKPQRPQCYCHGERHGEPMPMSSSHPGWTEWAYAFNVQQKTMQVYSIRENRASGQWNIWELLATVDLTGAEPDWEVIEAKR